MSTLRRSSSSFGSFADGIIIRGMPLLTLYPGNVYWVDSNGGGGSRGTFAHPVATLLAAHALCTADNGDIICIKPGHAETYTATVDFSKSGFAIIGLGFGDNRPTFTCGVTAAGDDMFDFAGDNVLIYNIKWLDANPAGSAAVVFNVSGNHFHIENCYITMGGITTGFLTHDTTLGTDLTVINNTIIGKEAGPDFGVKIEKEHFYAHISGNKWILGQSAGMDTGCVIFTSGVGSGQLLDGDTVLGLGDGEPYMVQTVAQADSLVQNMRLLSDDATDALGTSTAAGFGFIMNFATQPGTGVPAVIDITGVYPLNTTPAP
jgi:hypothetical protein